MSSGKIGMVFTSRNSSIKHAQQQAQALTPAPALAPAPARTQKGKIRLVHSMNSVINRTNNGCSSCGN